MMRVHFFFWTDSLVGKFSGLMDHEQQQADELVSKVGKVSFVSSSHSAAYVKIKVSDATTSATS